MLGVQYYCVVVKLENRQQDATLVPQQSKWDGHNALHVHLGQ